MVHCLDKGACLLSLAACLGMPNPLAACGIMALNVVCGSDVIPTKDVLSCWWLHVARPADSSGVCQHGCQKLPYVGESHLFVVGMG